MAVDLSHRLAHTIELELPNLRALSEDGASVPRAPGKWSAKQELGHLIDSAANNHIRFVRGTIESPFRGPGYVQDEWVRVHGYRDMAWDAIVDFWYTYNNFLAALIERIPDAALETQCFIGTYDPATLRFVIDDYILHMQHHIDQLLRREVITQYPRQTTGASY
jgi:hypothetical protein